jgi:hypothetical protein
VLPHAPNIIAPRQWVLTRRPVPPSPRYSMTLPPHVPTLPSQLWCNLA